MVAQGWFPVSTRSEKVASMGGPCLLCLPCSAQGQRKGAGLRRERKQQDKGPNALTGKASEAPGSWALDSGICFGLMMSSRCSGMQAGVSAHPPAANLV